MDGLPWEKPSEHTLQWTYNGNAPKRTDQSMKMGLPKCKNQEGLEVENI